MRLKKVARVIALFVAPPRPRLIGAGASASPSATGQLVDTITYDLRQMVCVYMKLLSMYLSPAKLTPTVSCESTVT